MADVDFKQTLSDAGIPTSKNELEIIWKQDVSDAGSLINNDSNFSPFWRIINTIVTTPALWLIDFVAQNVLPNSFVKYATGSFLDVLADGVNLTRKQAVAAAGVITFTRSDTSQAVTIPVDTIIQTASINGVIYQLKTTQQASFVATLETLDVTVVAVKTGIAFNFTAGYYSVLPAPILNIAAVTNGTDWLTTPGADVETDDYLRNRIRNQFGGASSHHTDSVYKSLISGFPGVAIDAIWFEHNAPRGPGTANAYVLFDFSAPVVQYLIDINKFITDDGHHGHGDDLLVFKMPEQNRTLTATIWHDEFLTPTQITTLQTDVDNFIKCAFRENSIYKTTQTKPYDRFSFSRLGQEIHREFASVHSVDFSLADIVSTLWIARLTALTITMQVRE